MFVISIMLCLCSQSNLKRRLSLGRTQYEAWVSCCYSWMVGYNSYHQILLRTSRRSRPWHEKQHCFLRIFTATATVYDSMLEIDFWWLSSHCIRWPLALTKRLDIYFFSFFAHSSVSFCSFLRWSFVEPVSSRSALTCSLRASTWQNFFTEQGSWFSAVLGRKDTKQGDKRGKMRAWSRKASNRIRTNLLCSPNC